MSTSIVKNPLDSDYFMLVHFAMLQNIFCELMCPNCGSNIILYDENLKRRGYSHFISVKCSNCDCIKDWIKAWYTSPETKPKEIKKIQGRRAFDINVRTVVAFRKIGCGFSAMDTFSSVMNLKCLTKGPFIQLNKVVKDY